MEKYVPCGNGLETQLFDLAREAEVRGEHTVADINGVQLGALPGENSTTLWERYHDMIRLAAK